MLPGLYEGFVLALVLFTKFFPIISVWETEKEDREKEKVKNRSWSPQCEFLKPDFTIVALKVPALHFLLIFYNSLLDFYQNKGYPVATFDFLN